MAIPQFFSQPNFNSEIKLQYRAVPDDDDIVKLYDSTENNLVELKIMSINIYHIYYVILFRSVQNGKLDGPCILIDSSIPDISKNVNDVVFSGIVLAKKTKFSEFKNVQKNYEVASGEIYNILNRVSNQSSTFISWLTSWWNGSSKMDFTKCHNLASDNEKYNCYCKDIKKSYNQCTSDVKQLQKITKNQVTMIAKKDMKIRETQKKLRDSNIIICLFMICVLFTFFLEETRMTYVKLYAYFIAFALILLYLMYLVWFT